jgi:hypothetical protein
MARRLQAQQTVINGWERKWERAPLPMAQHCSDLLTPAPPELGKRAFRRVVVSVLHSWARGRGFIRHAEGAESGPRRPMSDFGSRMGAAMLGQTAPNAVIMSLRWSLTWAKAVYLTVLTDCALSSHRGVRGSCLPSPEAQRDHRSRRSVGALARGRAPRSVISLRQPAVRPGWRGVRRRLLQVLSWPA